MSAVKIVHIALDTIAKVNGFVHDMDSVEGEAAIYSGRYYVDSQPIPPHILPFPFPHFYAIIRPDSINYCRYDDKKAVSGNQCLSCKKQTTQYPLFVRLQKKK